MKEIQQQVDTWIKRVGGGYFSELTNMVLLTEEVGELARIIARVYGQQKAKPGDLDGSLAEELVDVLWVIVCLANQTGVNLEEAFRSGLKKRYIRDAHRFLPSEDKNE